MERPSPLRVSLVQVELAWEDPVTNRSSLAGWLEALAGRTDLVVLPEMFTTGFTMRGAELAEPAEGPTLGWLREQAGRLGAALYGSVIVREGEGVYNRGLFVTPEGAVTSYDKRHLFRMGREDRHYTPGNRRVVAEWRGWRFLLQICYDLRFPVFSRSRNDYDALLYVANWPEPRRLAWTRLLAARAIENLAFAVGVNRVGGDGEGIRYAGDSGAWDFLGEPMRGEREDGPGEGLEGGRQGILTVRLDAPALEAFRERFPAHLDADGFELRLPDERGATKASAADLSGRSPEARRAPGRWPRG